jgi:hypothetical protein
MPLLGNLAKIEKMIVYTNIMAKGCMRAQPSPSADCL